MEMNFASKGSAATGIALGGTALGVSLLSGAAKGALSGIFGGGGGGHCDATTALVASMIANNSATRCNSDGAPVSRYEAGQAARIAELETEVKLRDANTYTDSKILDLYRYVDGKVTCIEGQIAQQAVYNATNTATLNCISNQVAQLMALTKTVIPAANICPEPMARYNSWTAPTTTEAAAG